MLTEISDESNTALHDSDTKGSGNTIVKANVNNIRNQIFKFPKSKIELKLSRFSQRQLKVRKTHFFLTY